MPRLTARRHSLRFLILYIHNLIEQERQVLRSPFMCVSLRKQLTTYTAAFVSALWVNSSERGFPSHIINFLEIFLPENDFFVSQSIQASANVIPRSESFDASLSG